MSVLEKPSPRQLFEQKYRLMSGSLKGGAFGDVYCCEQLADGRVFAVKIVAYERLVGCDPIFVSYRRPSLHLYPPFACISTFSNYLHHWHSFAPCIKSFESIISPTPIPQYMATTAMSVQFHHHTCSVFALSSRSYHLLLLTILCLPDLACLLPLHALGPSSKS